MKFFAVFAAILAVAIARPGSNIWTLQEVSQALENPNTNPTLVPYLEAALNEIMQALFDGQNVLGVHMPVLAELASPIRPDVAEVAAPPSKSPLVEIIINVNGKQQSIIPTPVHVVDALEPSLTEPINPVPESEVPVNPVDVIAVNPPDVWGPEDLIEPINPVPEFEVPVNPVDVIAVNPPDVWGPEGSLLPVNAIDVGPM